MHGFGRLLIAWLNCTIQMRATEGIETIEGDCLAGRENITARLRSELPSITAPEGHI